MKRCQKWIIKASWHRTDAQLTHLSQPPASGLGLLPPLPAGDAIVPVEPVEQQGEQVEVPRLSGPPPFRGRSARKCDPAAFVEPIQLPLHGRPLPGKSRELLTCLWMPQVRLHLPTVREEFVAGRVDAWQGRRPPGMGPLSRCLALRRPIPGSLRRRRPRAVKRRLTRSSAWP